MGQKVNPVGLRLGINRTADSRWYADSADFGRLLHEDLKVRKFIRGKLKQAGISKIVIERPHKKCLVTIHTARPGLVIGPKGAEVDRMTEELQYMTGRKVGISIIEIKNPDMDAQLVAESVAEQLKKRARGPGELRCARPVRQP